MVGADIFTNAADSNWPAFRLSPPSASTLAKQSTNPTNQISADSHNAGDPTNSVAVSSGNLDDKHVLEPGDKISFQILEDEKDPFAENKGPINLTITDSSEVDVPHIGRVSVAGKTCQKLAAELKVLLEKDYYYHATVVVGLNSVSQVRGEAFVAGEVRAQGALNIMFNHNLTAGEAILLVGGLDDFADKKAVKIIRNDGTNEQTFVVNMVDVLEKGEIDKDIILQPGDFVIVPAKTLNF